MKAVAVITTLALLITTLALTTQIPEKELSELVKMADHIIVAKVVKVDMIDKDGNEVKDEEARTGPGLENEIRLHIKVVENGIIETNGNKNVEDLVVPLWQKWFYTLGTTKTELEGRTFIFLLEGENYERVYPGLFIREMSDREEIEKLLAQSKPEDQPAGTNDKTDDAATKSKGSTDNEN